MKGRKQTKINQVKSLSLSYKKLILVKQGFCQSFSFWDPTSAQLESMAMSVMIPSFPSCNPNPMSLTTGTLPEESSAMD